jgi:hypothetical protein
VPNSQQLAECLRAHARLYRQIAEQTWSETKVEELIRLAGECARAADAIVEIDKRDATRRRVPEIANSRAAATRAGCP